MDMALDKPDDSSLAADFERSAMMADDAAARETLALGLPIHIARDDTPAGYVVRVFPDGREQLIAVDRDAAARILGR